MIGFATIPRAGANASALDPSVALRVWWADKKAETSALKQLKKVAEIRTKLGELARRLAAQELSAGAVHELQSLVGCVSAHDFTGAQRHHLNLVKTDWANNNEWLLGLKTMLLMAKKFLERTG